MIRRARRWFLVAGALLLLGGCLHPPVLWSPDGRWLAYTQADRPFADVLPPGWLFDNGSDLPAARGRTPGSYRLWATRADDRRSVLLAESRAPLTSPGWHPEGTALAYGRLVPEDQGRGRFELVVEDGPGRSRVVLSRPLDSIPAEAALLPASAVAWSPDARHLATPNLQPPGLAVVRADGGRLVKEVPGGFAGSWSPDGSKLAFYRRGDGPDGLYVLDVAAAGGPRFLTDLGRSEFPPPPPAWARDGRTVMVPRTTNGQGSVQAQLVSVQVDNGRAEVVLESVFFNRQPLPADVPLRGVSFGLDPHGEDLFSVALAEGQESLILWWSRPREGQMLKPFNPIDPNVPVGALAGSPAGGVLAMRFGEPGVLSPPALCTPTPGLESDKIQLLAPDDATRAEWVALLVRSACGVLGAADVPNLGGEPLARPTRLPAPGELPRDHPTSSRLHHLAKLGRPLCNRPSDAPPADPALAALLAEARLFFDYLLGDYAAALDDLDDLEPRADRPEWRRALLSLRAQIYLGLDDLERAEGTISYLRRFAASPAQPIEFTPLGPVLTPNDEPDPAARWSEYLATVASGRRAGRPDNAADELPLGHHNPDNPAADALFDLPPAPARPVPPNLPVVPFVEGRP